MQQGKSKVRIPNPHQGDIGIDLLANVLRQAGISRDEWLDSTGLTTPWPECTEALLSPQSSAERVTRALRRSIVNSASRSRSVTCRRSILLRSHRLAIPWRNKAT